MKLWSAGIEITNLTEINFERTATEIRFSQAKRDILPVRNLHLDRFHQHSGGVGLRRGGANPQIVGARRFLAEWKRKAGCNHSSGESPFQMNQANPDSKSMKDQRPQLRANVIQPCLGFPVGRLVSDDREFFPAKC